MEERLQWGNYASFLVCLSGVVLSKEGNSSSVLPEMITEMDTIQFYSKVCLKNSKGQETLKSGCISFNNNGVSIRW